MITVLTVVSKERGFSTKWAIYLQRLPTVAASDLSCFNGVPTFRASLGANGVDFSTEGTNIIICRYEFSAVLTRMFVAWHSLVSFLPFCCIIQLLGIES
jgi:hypothetical protein